MGLKFRAEWALNENKGNTGLDGEGRKKAIKNVRDGVAMT